MHSMHMEIRVRLAMYAFAAGHMYMERTQLASTRCAYAAGTLSPLASMDKQSQGLEEEEARAALHSQILL